MNAEIATGLAATTIALAMPLLVAALGEVVVEKAGVINVGIEGMMLTGAFCAYAASLLTHSALLGALAATGSGVALALVFALAAFVFDADQVVVGTALNILALGVTGVFYQSLLTAHPELTTAASFAPLPIPLLSRIPIVGPALFAQNALVYLGFALIPCVFFFLRRTRLGLRLRASGEYPAAADVAGVSVVRLRTGALLFGGGMAGLAGAFLSIAYTVGFAQNMSGGRGFIALAVVIVGRWSPVGALLAALLFGFASALQFQFQSTSSHVPYQVFLALPYVLTLLALFINTGRSAAPAMLGLPYKRS